MKRLLKKFSQKAGLPPGSLVHVGERVLQPALLMRGVSCPEPEAVAFDRALFDTIERLRFWEEGLGTLAEPHFDEAQRALIPRTKDRIKK